MTIKQKQCLLAWCGYLQPKEIDGIWGPRSAHATECMQEDLDLVPDGIWGTQTDAAIREFIFSGQDITPEETAPTGTWWDGIRYWTREEWCCQCGGRYCNGFPAEPDRTLVELVDDIRHEAGRPGHRSSGLRCEIHNSNEGGVWNSKHMAGKALDFMIEDMTGQQLLALAQADSRTNYAYIIGSGPYVHVDVK